MNKPWMMSLAIAASVAVLAGCRSSWAVSGGSVGQQEQEQASRHAEEGKASEQENIKNVVEGFGKQLQFVSLLAPEETVRASMEKYYGRYITPALLKKWQNDPAAAPGRTVSSPWPDRINVQSVVKEKDGSYTVKGEIIEVTSSGVEAKRPITLGVHNIDGRWLIDAVTLGTYEETAAETISYDNPQFGFRFALPTSWKGFTVITEQWEGTPAEGSAKGKAITGPKLSIRHPLWTAEKPRQDIPILVFTVEQWNQLQQEKFHIGAAPVGLSELSRNAKHVFALPARYNFAFPEGYEEVESILIHKPLQAYEPENVK